MCTSRVLWALAQIPDALRYGTDILIRSDSAGCTHGFLAHIGSLREHGVNTRFSVGVAITGPVRDAIAHAVCWIDAVDADGELRDGAQPCEITGLLPDQYRVPTTPRAPGSSPAANARTRRQLSLFDLDAGWRHQVMATDTPIVGGGSIQYLEARHRAHARVEDRIRTGKDLGFGHFPSRVFAINQAWLELALTGIDLLAWTQHLLLSGDLARAEPKKLRYRLLHVAARITRSARRTRFVGVASQHPVLAPSRRTRLCSMTPGRNITRSSLSTGGVTWLSTQRRSPMASGK